MPQQNRPRHLRMSGGFSSYPVAVDILEEMRRSAARDAALARPPEQPVQILAQPVLVRVRAVYGRAIAVTAGHVLHEWVRYGAYHCRWDRKALVERVQAEEWGGEVID